jgi:DNA-directed RNA polymerase specialized sigma24 family protein
VARRLFGSEGDAREAVRESFVSMLDAPISGRGALSVESRLHLHVVGRALSQARHPDGPLEEGGIVDILPTYDDSGHALARVPTDSGRNGGREGFCAAMEILPEPYRTGFVLHDVEGFERGEAATLMSLSVRELMTTVHRARQALMSLMGEPRPA